MKYKTIRKIWIICKIRDETVTDICKGANGAIWSTLKFETRGHKNVFDLLVRKHLEWFLRYFSEQETKNDWSKTAGRY